MAPPDGLFAHLHAHCGPVSLVAADPARLAELVAAGLCLDDPSATVGSWYDPDDLAASAARAEAYHRRCLTRAAPHRWTLSLGVVADGELAGSLTVHPSASAPRRVATSSWLAPRFRHRGVGTLARAAALHAAFAALGAHSAESVVAVGNAASEAVSVKLGYRRDATLLVGGGAGAAHVATRFVVDQASLRLPGPAAAHGFDAFAAAVAG